METDRLIIGWLERWLVNKYNILETLVRIEYFKDIFFLSGNVIEILSIFLPLQSCRNPSEGLE